MRLNDKLNVGCVCVVSICMGMPHYPIYIQWNLCSIPFRWRNESNEMVRCRLLLCGLDQMRMCAWDFQLVALADFIPCLCNATYAKTTIEKETNRNGNNGCCQRAVCWVSERARAHTRYYVLHKQVADIRKRYILWQTWDFIGINRATERDGNNIICVDYIRLQIPKEFDLVNVIYRQIKFAARRPIALLGHVFFCCFFFSSSSSSSSSQFVVSFFSLLLCHRIRCRICHSHTMPIFAHLDMKIGLICVQIDS